MERMGLRVWERERKYCQKPLGICDQEKGGGKIGKERRGGSEKERGGEGEKKMSN